MLQRLVIKPTLIHTNVRLDHTISYETGSNCTNRNYSVTPKSFFLQLELQPSNRSGNTIDLTINITFVSCPIGFEQSNFTGECIRDHRIWQYANSCDIDLGVVRILYLKVYDFHTRSHFVGQWNSSNVHVDPLLALY